MSDSTEEYIGRIVAGLSGGLYHDLKTSWEKSKGICESPIEIALALSILFSDRIDPMPYQPLIFARQDEIEHYGDCARLLVPQYKIDDKRIDFLLVCPPVQIYIECDGHNFHERTKEQAARDRQRDRKLQQTGTPVLRFTGSEIFADPVGCAAQVFDFVGDLHMHDHFRKQA